METTAVVPRAQGPDAGNGLAGERLLLIDVIDAEGVILVQTIWTTTPDRRAGPRLTRFEKFVTLPVLQQRLGELAALKERDAAWRARVLPIIAAIQSTGVTSPPEIAGELTRRGVLSARGGRWRGETVDKLLLSATTRLTLLAIGSPAFCRVALRLTHSVDR